MTNRSPSDRSPSISLPDEGHAALPAFELAPNLIHLNHGSYGAVPKVVRAEQERWREQIEADPTGFFQHIYPAAVRRAADVAASNFGGGSHDWVFCENATAAVSSVLSSLRFQPGDELVTTSHCYGAVRKAMQWWAQRTGAVLRVADIPVCVESDAQITAAIAAVLGGRTRLVVVDHITSPTAIIFPVEQMVQLAHEAGAAVLVDGAHAPGHIELDVPAIGADWYTGNAHKWFFALRGCGLLWTAPRWQEITRPAVLSHGTDQGYTAAFDWIGTRDSTPWLCLETAARAHEAFGGAALRQRNRALAAEAAEIMKAETGGKPSAPASMRGAMISLCFAARQDPAEAAARLREDLRAQGIVVAASGFGGFVCLRLSAQIYNAPADYRRFAQALSDKGFGRAIVSAI